MYERKTMLINPTGLHARPASIFVGEAGKFKSNIILHKLDENGAPVKNCDAKSIVFLLTMGLSKGTAIELSADGIDEMLAVDTLVNLIEGGFGEL